LTPQQQSLALAASQQQGPEKPGQRHSMQRFSIRGLASRSEISLLPGLPVKLIRYQSFITASFFFCAYLRMGQAHAGQAEKDSESGEFHDEDG